MLFLFLCFGIGFFVQQSEMVFVTLLAHRRCMTFTRDTRADAEISEVGSEVARRSLLIIHKTVIGTKFVGIS